MTVSTGFQVVAVLTFVFFVVHAKKNFGKDFEVVREGEEYIWKRNIDGITVDESAYYQQDRRRVVYISEDAKLRDKDIEPSISFYEFTENEVAIRPVEHSPYVCFLIDVANLGATEGGIVSELKSVAGKTVNADAPKRFLARPMGIMEAYNFYRNSEKHQESCSFRRLYKTVEIAGDAEVPQGAEDFHFVTINHKVEVYIPAQKKRK